MGIINTILDAYFMFFIMYIIVPALTYPAITCGALCGAMVGVVIWSDDLI